MLVAIPRCLQWRHGAKTVWDQPINNYWVNCPVGTDSTPSSGNTVLKQFGISPYWVNCPVGTDSTPSSGNSAKTVWDQPINNYWVNCPVGTDSIPSSGNTVLKPFGISP